MEINRAAWMEYVDDLKKINNAAYDLIIKYLTENEILTDEGFMAFTNYFFNTVTACGEAAAEVACQAYEAMAAAQGVRVPSAIPAEPPSYGECIRAARGTMLQSSQDVMLAQTASRLVKRTGVDTTMKNAIRDGAEWAWVPAGDTCAFCVMLASNGWQRASKKALKNGHAEHIHANCDCTYAVRFDEKTTVENYDPSEYKTMYDDAEGTRWQDKLNSMRRDFYQENKEEINEQKRDAYEKRKERESSTAEETNVGET